MTIANSDDNKKIIADSKCGLVLVHGWLNTLGAAQASNNYKQ
jgi:hypothetical protein